MIVCTNCGNHNGDTDEFCGSCGKFLEWVGQKVEDPKPVEVVAPEPEEEDAKVGLLDRVKAAVGMEGGAAGSGPGAAGAAPVLEDEPPPPPPPPSAADAEASAASAKAAADAQAAEAAAAATEAAAVATAAAAEAEAQAQAAAAEAQANAQAKEQARLEAEEQARRAAEEKSRQEAEAAARRAAEVEAAETARRRADAEAAAAEAAKRQQEAEAAEAARTHAQAEAADAARRESEAKNAEAAAAAATESARLQAEAEAAEAARKQAAAEAAAAEEERKRTEAEAAEAARKQAEAEDARKHADEERQRREAAARADAARRAATLLSQPRPAAAPAPAAAETTAPAGAAATPASAAHATAPTASAAAPAPPRPAAAVAPSQEPARPKAPPRPATQVHVDEGPKPGDLICTECGTGNDPTRKFCRRCGNSLAKAEPHRKVPWWKRLFSRKARTKAAAEPGSKKSRRDAGRQVQYRTRMAMATVRKLVFFLAVVGVAVPFALPNTRKILMDKGSGAISSVRDKLFPSFEAVNAVAVTATSSAPDHPPSMAADLAVNTFWSEGAPAEGIGQTISFTFQGKQDLLRVIITPGATDVAGSFLKEPRPKKLHVTYDNGKSTDLTLKDELKAQTFTLKDAKGVTKVDMAIAEVYAGQGGQNTSIAEVEFKRKG